MFSWFISDLHLDPAHAEGLEALSRCLDAIDRHGGSLYVLGDLFEMWIGDDDDEPFVDACCDRLQAFARAHSLFALHGNRDFMLGAGFERRSGAKLLDAESIVQIGAQRALLLHGDSLCTDDVDYMRLREQVRAPTWQQQMLARPLTERRAFGAALRARSRTENANKPSAITDVNLAATARCASEHGVTLMVHGHTHRPAVHRADSPHAFTRIVLGDWSPEGVLLRAGDDGSFALIRSDQVG